MHYKSGNTNTAAADNLSILTKNFSQHRIKSQQTPHKLRGLPSLPFPAFQNKSNKTRVQTTYTPNYFLPQTRVFTSRIFEFLISRAQYQ